MTLLLNNADLGPLIAPTEFIESLDKAYRAYALGEDGICAPRIDIQSAEMTPQMNYQLGLAVGMSDKYAALRIKSDVVRRSLLDGKARKDKYCVEPGTYMGLVLLFNRGNGELLAILHDGLLQKMRVGADSALGIRYMARENAHVLGILGSGGMARAHVAAVSKVRRVDKIRIYSPNRQNRENFADEIKHSHDIDAVAVESPEMVYEGADVVSSCASAIGPVIHGEYLKPGMHVTCIGGTLDQAANAKIGKALRFGTAPAPAELPDVSFEGECITFSQSGGKAAHGGTGRYANIPADRHVSFAALIQDPALGRQNDDQITFSERGNIHGVQFAAIAGLLFERAQKAGVGERLSSEMFLQSIRN
jgi:ornithine cyclodeaminase/alanine dehydrogenase-like protein (mu-crystallin family)